MKNTLFSRKATLFIAFNIFALTFGMSQSTLAGNTTYSELLNNCANRIYDLGYDSEKVSLKLDRKFKKAGNYRFWIDIIDTESKKTTRAYCSGKIKGGVVDELEIIQ